MADLLSPEQTLAYLKAWRENEDRDAYTQLTIKNMGLVVYYVQKYIDCGLSFDELKSAGTEGLLNAINQFDYHQYNIDIFPSYMAVSIKRLILKELRKYHKHSHVLSISEPLGNNSKSNDPITIEDIVGSDDEELLDNLIHKMQIKFVKEVLECLSPRERKIILLKYGLDGHVPKSYEAIAKIFNCSPSRIEADERHALNKMRLLKRPVLPNSQSNQNKEKKMTFDRKKKYKY